MIDLRIIVVVGIGAAIGGVLRYIVGQLFVQRFGPGFPYGTVFINVTGSFLIGLIAELSITRALGITPTVRAFAATGILGGYTTFSTFSLESVNLMDQGWYLTALYIGASVILGVIGSGLGAICARAAVR